MFRVKTRARSVAGSLFALGTAIATSTFAGGFAATPAEAATTAAAGISPMAVTAPIAGDATPSVKPGQRLPVTSVDLQRLAGPNRIDTAVQISKRAFPNGSEDVYIARAYGSLADALTAGSLTKGSILLVPTDGTLPASVAAEIQRLNPRQVIALGSTSSVSDDMLNQASAGRPSQRLGGASRYSTAVEISKYAFPDGAANVAYADGFGPDGNGSPDAVAGGTLPKTAVLYTPREAGPDSDLVAAEARRLTGTHYQLGSDSSFNPYQLSTFVAQEKLAGGNRLQTAVKIAMKAYGSTKTVYLANAAVYADAVAAGALIDGPVFLVYPNGAPDRSTLEAIAAFKPQQVISLGSDRSIANAALYFGGRAAQTGSAPADTSLSGNAAIALSAGGDHTCATIANGSVNCWGSNRFGQLGNNNMGVNTGYDIIQNPNNLPDGGNLGTFTGMNPSNPNHSTPTPVQVQNLGFAVSTESGLSHACAIDMTGVLNCWGSNLTGQLGTGDQWSRGAATVVSGIGKVVSVSAAGETNQPWRMREFRNQAEMLQNQPSGDHNDWIPTGTGHTCAVQADGAVFCWGDNTYGQVGDGTQGGHIYGDTWGVFTKIDDPGNRTKLRPVKVNMPVAATSVAVGETFSCAVGVDENVYCWGTFRHDWGYPSARESNGNNFDSTTPKVVPGLGGTKHLEAGEYYACAQNGATHACFGYNSRQQFVPETSYQQRHMLGATPRMLINSVDYSLGRNSSCNVTTAGNVQCWGLNDAGQLGRKQDPGTNSDSYAGPGLVALDQPATGVAVGWAHGCALTRDGGVRCWGFNPDGQLGNGYLFGQWCKAWQTQGLGTAVAPLNNQFDDGCK